MAHVNVRESLLSDEASRELDRVFAHLDTDYRARRADAIGEEPEASLRTTTDLDDTRAHRDADLLEEAPGLVRELARLLLETLLLGHAVAEEVRVTFCHGASGWDRAIPYR